VLQPLSGLGFRKDYFYRVKNNLDKNDERTVFLDSAEVPKLWGTSPVGASCFSEGHIYFEGNKGARLRYSACAPTIYDVVRN
jgi:hypothetical protein